VALLSFAETEVTGEKQFLRICLAAMTGILLIACSISPEAKRDRYLRAGQDFLAKKDYSRALLSFQNAYKAKPSDAEPLYQLGVTSIAMGDTISASDFFRRAVQLNPGHLEAQLKLADLLAASRHKPAIQEGQKMAQQALAAFPDNLKAVNILALTELRLGDAEAAAARLEEALKRFPASLESSVNLARTHLARNDRKAAEEILRKAVGTSPSDASALFALADFYLITGTLEAAAEYYTRGLSVQPDHAPALSALGRVQHRLGRAQEADATFVRLAAHPEAQHRFVHAGYLLQSGRQDAALTEFQQIYEKNRQDREARTYLVTAFLTAGRIESAQQLLTEALAVNPNDADALLPRARIHLARGRTDAADRDVQRALQWNPDSAEVHHLLAQVHRIRGNAGLQQQELAEALRLDPGLTAARLDLAQALLVRGDAGGALRVLDAAPPEQRGNLPLTVQRTWVLMDAGRESEARTTIDRMLLGSRLPEVILQDAVLRARTQDFAGAKTGAETVLKEQPHEVRALELLFRVSLAEKRPNEGLDRIRRHASAHPDIAPVQMIAGRLEQKHGNLPGARAAFERAKQSDPDLLDAEVSLSEIELAEGKLEDARRRLMPLLETSRQAAARTRLGLVEEKAGKYTAACDHYRKALELNPRDVLVLNNLAYALAEFAGKPEEALKYAEQAKELSPDSAAIDNTLGWTYFRKGIYPSAIRYLEASVNREPTARRTAHLAMAYARAGDMAGCKRALAAALRLDPNLPEAETISRMMSETVVNQ
jgi:tetratricopeptide (TPR) repeat protein